MKRIKLAAYLQERFPPVNMMLFAILFCAVFTVATAGNMPGWKELWGIAAVIGFFFRLRVMDEIKDFRIDKINHPNRILQSGGISISVLIIIASFSWLIELGWSIYSGYLCILAWAAAFIYSLLMRYEFFVGTWLKKRLLVYAISHMLIMPMIIAWVWFAYRTDTSEVLWLLMVLSLTAGFSFEIARKTHSTEAERQGIDSYSNSLGLPYAVYTIWVLMAIGLAFLFYLFSILNIHFYAYIVLGLVFLTVLWAYIKGLKTGVDKHFRKGEKAVSLYMLLSYMVLIIEMLR